MTRLLRPLFGQLFKPLAGGDVGGNVIPQAFLDLVPEGIQANGTWLNDPAAPGGTDLDFITIVGNTAGFTRQVDPVTQRFVVRVVDGNTATGGNLRSRAIRTISTPFTFATFLDVNPATGLPTTSTLMSSWSSGSNRYEFRRNNGDYELGGIQGVASQPEKRGRIAITGRIKANGLIDFYVTGGLDQRNVVVAGTGLDWQVGRIFSDNAGLAGLANVNVGAIQVWTEALSDAQYDRLIHLYEVLAQVNTPDVYYTPESITNNANGWANTGLDPSSLDMQRVGPGSGMDRVVDPVTGFFMVRARVPTAHMRTQTLVTYTNTNTIVMVVVWDTLTIDGQFIFDARNGFGRQTLRRTAAGFEMDRPTDGGGTTPAVIQTGPTGRAVIAGRFKEANLFDFYISGLGDIVDHDPGGTAAASFNLLTLLSDENGNNEAGDLDISDVGVWNRALTDAEYRALIDGLEAKWEINP